MGPQWCRVGGETQKDPPGLRVCASFLGVILVWGGAFLPLEAPRTETTFVHPQKLLVTSRDFALVTSSDALVTIVVRFVR